MESSACTQSEEQNDDSNNYYTKDINAETFRVYPDGKYVSEEDSSHCFYINPEAGTTYECEERTETAHWAPIFFTECRMFTKIMVLFSLLPFTFAFFIL